MRRFRWVSALPGSAAALKKSGSPARARTVSLTSLQYAAEGGPSAPPQWKTGGGCTPTVKRGHPGRFWRGPSNISARIANAHAEDSPSAPQASVVADAFVALGALLSQRHSQLEDQVGSGRAGEGDVSPTPPRISAMPMRQYGPGPAVPQRRRHLAGRLPLWRAALARSCRPERASIRPQALARPDAVQRRAVCRVRPPAG